jgi:hypothetical protein
MKLLATAIHNSVTDIKTALRRGAVYIHFVVFGRPYSTEIADARLIGNFLEVRNKESGDWLRPSRSDTFSQEEQA